MSDVQYGSGREGLAGRNFTTRRTQTCEKLFQLVAERGYLVIQAPPQSGKTSTLQLLMERAGRQYPSLKLAYINLSLEGSRFQMDDVFRARLGGTLDEIMEGECSTCGRTSCPRGLQLSCFACKACMVASLLVGLPCMLSGKWQMLQWECMTTCMLAGGESTLVCIDEAQIAYHVERTGSTGFWNQLKRLESGPGNLTAPHDTRVVIAAAYGTKHSAADEAKLESSSALPVNFEFPGMVVTVFPSRSGASLQLSSVEWSELWDDFTGFTGLQLGSLIKDHIGSICLGQVRLAWVALSVVLLMLHQLLPHSCPCASSAKQ